MLWHGKTGKEVGHVDTNQLKNNMAAISPDGRFIAAAAFTGDVKVKIILRPWLLVKNNNITPSAHGWRFYCHGTSCLLYLR